MVCAFPLYREQWRFVKIELLYTPGTIPKWFWTNNEVIRDFLRYQPYESYLTDLDSVKTEMLEYVLKANAVPDNNIFGKEKQKHNKRPTSQSLQAYRINLATKKYLEIWGHLYLFVFSVSLRNVTRDLFSLLACFISLK